jgi:GR25 family glycosyltransferase involved in LPS biosynthesis
LSTLQHVPAVDLDYGGDCIQDVGLDLPVVVINLSHRIDRWQAVSSRMAAVGLNKLIKARAVEGAQLPACQIAALLNAPAAYIEEPPCSHLMLTRPAIGCFLSHLSIWHWVIENNLPRVLIFEDDAAPAAHFDPARFCKVLTSIPLDFGMVFLGRIIMNGMADRPDGSDLARIFYFNGTFAYLVTPAACRTLIRHLLPLDRHIDHQISKMLIERRHVFAAYYTEPQFFEPDWSLRSDCYVPLSLEKDADRELDQILGTNRR